MRLILVPRNLASSTAQCPPLAAPWAALVYSVHVPFHAMRPTELAGTTSLITVPSSTETTPRLATFAPQIDEPRLPAQMVAAFNQTISCFRSLDDVPTDLCFVQDLGCPSPGIPKEAVLLHSVDKVHFLRHCALSSLACLFDKRTLPGRLWLRQKVGRPPAGPKRGRIVQPSGCAHGLAFRFTIPLLRCRPHARRFPSSAKPNDALMLQDPSWHFRVSSWNRCRLFDRYDRKWELLQSSRS